MTNPRILLLDEPFGALDLGTRSAMHELLVSLWERTCMTVLMVTHDLEEGFRLAKRVIVLSKTRWDPQEPDAFGATVAEDLVLEGADSRIGGIQRVSALLRRTSPITGEVPS